MPLQNMPLCHKDQFEFKATEKKQIHEKVSTCLKAGYTFEEAFPFPSLFSRKNEKS